MSRTLAIQSTSNAALLIAGTAIGAGMLALPVLTAQAGFWPALLLFGICALLMACTGLLVIDVCQKVPGASNLLSLAQATLGRAGRWVTWVVYLGLFYSLLVAYQSAAGELFAGMTRLPPFAGQLLMVGGSLVVVTLGTGAVQRLNGVLMVGLIITYMLFMVMGLPEVSPEPLTRTYWPAALIAMPVAFTAFGYQGVLPSLVSHMQGRLHLLKKAIWLGLGLVFLVYCLWELVVLAIVPLDGLQAAMERGHSAVTPLQDQLHAPWLMIAGQFFGLFAIVTSYLSPHLFLSALKYGGGVGSAFLLALLPIAMAWKTGSRRGPLIACLALVGVDLAIELTLLLT
jgi:tyrosine-specific transport protein